MITARDLIIYILQNVLEDKKVLDDDKKKTALKLFTGWLRKKKTLEQKRYLRYVKYTMSQPY